MGYFSRYSDKAKGLANQKFGVRLPACLHVSEQLWPPKNFIIGIFTVCFETLQFWLNSNTIITDILNEDLLSFMISVSGCSLLLRQYYLWSRQRDQRKSFYNWEILVISKLRDEAEEKIEHWASRTTDFRRQALVFKKTRF